MAGLLKILQGGKLRWNAKTAAATTYSRGQAIYIASDGTLTKYDGTQAAVVGLALETCVSAATGNPMANTQTVVAGKTGSILLGQAIVEDDNLTTGTTFAVGDLVYEASAATLGSSGLGTHLLGRSIKNCASDWVARFNYRANI